MRAVPQGRVRVSLHGDVFWVTVHGETDCADAEEFEAVWQAADEAGLSVTAVDLSRVTFADSMLLNTLLDARRRHQRAGREFILLGPLPPPVHRLLELSGTLPHFTVADTGPSTTS
ncbi:STAS domain-containing protein [Streptomyces sp. NPDC001941]|uniref:STAS domain-containing protein n=1 Tax=Streptomyces sp. NPDC001941 TaxID=3154659 RepID=UPI003325E2C0